MDWRVTTACRSANGVWPAAAQAGLVDAHDADLAHVWFGTRVKKTSAGYVPVKNARDELVRKAACRVVAQEAGA